MLHHFKLWSFVWISLSLSIQKEARIIWDFPKWLRPFVWIQWLKYLLSKRFEPATSCVRDQDVIIAAAGNGWEIGSLNWLQFILQWFIRFHEFAEFTEFLLHLGKSPPRIIGKSSKHAGKNAHQPPGLQGSKGPPSLWNLVQLSQEVNSGGVSSPRRVDTWFLKNWPKKRLILKVVLADHPF